MTLVEKQFNKKQRHFQTAFYLQASLIKLIVSFDVRLATD